MNRNIGGNRRYDFPFPVDGPPLLPVPGYPPNKTAATLGDGPSSYPEDSPLVPGWEPWVDRDVARYIRPGEDTVLSGEYGRVYTCAQVEKK